MAEITVTVQPSGEAYVTLVVGEPPEVRESVALDALDAANEIPTLDSLVLDFDFYGRVVGLRVLDAVDSALSPSLLDAAAPEIDGRPFSLPCFAVPELAAALKRVEALGGSVVQPGEAWAICEDSEGRPFGLARRT